MKPEETRLFNPWILVLAVFVVGTGLIVGFWVAYKGSGPAEPSGPALRLVESKPKTKGPKEQPTPAPSKEEPSSKEAEVKTEPQESEVTGKVFLGSSETRAPGTKVQAFKLGGIEAPIVVSTNPIGEFRFEDLPIGEGKRRFEWDLRAVGEGFAEVHAKTYDRHIWFERGKPPTIQDVALRVIASATLGGKVLNVIGKEIPGATVQVFEGRNLAGVNVSGPHTHSKKSHRPGLLEIENPLATTTADKSGSFHFSSLEPGTYGLVAFATGYGRKSIQGALTATSKTVFRLEPEVRVSGSVHIAPSGAVLPGATITVTVTPKDSPAITGTLVSTSTGSYEIRNLPRKFDLAIQASTEKAESALYKVSFSGGISQYQQNLLIIPDRKITGRVVDSSTKQPIPEVDIQLIYQKQANTVAGQTDAEGHLSISTGRINNVLLLQKEGGYKEVKTVANFVGDNASLDLGDIRIIHGVRIAGRVVSEKSKAGVGNAQIRAIPAGQATLQFDENLNAASGPSGDFELPIVPPGKYYLSAECPGYKAAFYGDPKPATEGAHPILNILPDRPQRGLQVVLPSSATVSLQGMVVDATGTGVAGANVSLSNNLKATTSEQGTFEFKDVPTGTYIIQAGHEGYSGFIDQVHVLPKQESPLFRIVLEKEKILSISGKVTDSDGRGLAPAQIMAIGGSMETLFSKGLLTLDGLPKRSFFPNMVTGEGGIGYAKEPDGNYEIKKLHPGKYTVAVVNHNSGATDARYDVDAGATGVDFILSTGGSLKGIVYLADGRAPCKSYTVEALFVSLPASWRNHAQNVQSEDGSFEITGLPDGFYTLHARAEGIGETSVFGLEVAKGKGPESLNLILNGGGAILGRVVGPNGQSVTNTTAKLGEVVQSVPEAGTFSFLGLAQDQYTLVVTNEDYAPIVVSNIQVAPGKPADLGTLTFGPGGSIEGRVRFASGEGSPDYFVEAQLSDSMVTPELIGEARTRSDASGFFTIPKLSQGAYQVVLRSSDLTNGASFGQPVQSKTVQVQAGAPTQVEFLVDAGAHVSGKITFGGVPLAQSTFVIYPRSQSSVSEYMTFTDKWGNYEFDGVLPGNYEGVAAEFSPDNSKKVSFTVPDQPVLEQNFTFK
jgi:protocatechuate 3,4-dioxygenase beta subunit